MRAVRIVPVFRPKTGRQEEIMYYRKNTTENGAERSNGSCGGICLKAAAWSVIGKNTEQTYETPFGRFEEIAARCAS